MTGLRHGYVMAGNIRLHYAAMGDPRHPPIIFLHGFPEFWYGWKPVKEKLADRFYCLAPDQRGYNLSAKPADVKAYRAARMIEDVGAFADAMLGEGAQFTLAAHDWGGAVGWGFALKHPQRLERLFIANALHPGAYQRELATNPAQRKASTYIDEMHAPDADARYRADDFAILWENFQPLLEAGVMDQADRAAYLAAWAQPGAVTAMLNWYRAMQIKPKDGAAAPSAPVDESVFTVHVPTRVVWGMNDHAIMPGCLESLPDFVPDLEIKRFEDGTHWVLHEYPTEIAALFADWMG